MGHPMRPPSSQYQMRSYSDESSSNSLNCCNSFQPQQHMSLTGDRQSSSSGDGDGDGGSSAVGDEGQQEEDIMITRGD